MLVFEERGKREYLEKNISEQRKEPKQTQATYGIDAGIWTRATLVGGKSSHLCTIPCGSDIKNFKLLVILMAFKVKLGHINFVLSSRREYSA